MSADRTAYGARQAQFLDALLRGGDYPDGVVAAKADAASQSLRRKREGAVRKAWPALVVSLGEQFRPRFDAWARRTGPPAAGAALTDGLAFASSLARDELSDDARAEVLLARAIAQRHRGGWRPRRGFFLAGARLHHPHRLLVVMRLPAAGRRVVAVPLPGKRG